MTRYYYKSRFIPQRVVCVNIGQPRFLELGRIRETLQVNSNSWVTRIARSFQVQDNGVVVYGSITPATGLVLLGCTALMTSLSSTRH